MYCPEPELLAPKMVLARGFGRELEGGRPAEVRAAYGGRPGPSSAGTGWMWFHDGGALVAPQPDGAATLFPCNDHPPDKATFTFDLTTPSGTTGVANGTPEYLSSPSTRWKRVVWTETAPFPTYAAVVAVSPFKLQRQTTPEGLEIINAFPPQHARALGGRFARQGEIVSVLEGYFGPYPYSSAGARIRSSVRPLRAA